MAEDLVLDTKRTYLDTSTKARDAIIRLREVLKVKNKQAYFIAIALGYKYNCRVEKFKKSSVGLPRIENLRNPDIALLFALQLAVAKSPDSLLDHEAMLDLAEQYAEGGAQWLIKQGVLEQGPDATKKWLTKELRQSIDAVKVQPSDADKDED